MFTWKHLPNALAARRKLVTMLMCTFGVTGASTDYLPATDSELDAWQQNFNTRIVADPTRYGLDAAYAADLTPLSTAFTAALIASTEPITRGPVTVAAKNAAKASLKSFIRAGVNIISATLSVTNEAKAELQITIRNNAPSPIPTPTTKPIIGAAAAGSQRVRITYTDELTPLSKAKPFGAIALLLQYQASATPITDPELLNENVALVTKSPFDIELAPADAGKTLYMAAQWTTRTGKKGPFSTIASAGVAA